MPSRHVIIQGGVVVNAILSTAEFAATLGGTVLQSDTANIGDTYSGGVFTTPPPPPPPVPAFVSMAQAQIALARAGIDPATVEAVIAAMPAGLPKTEASIWWNKSNDVYRNHPTVLALAPALGLTDTQLDDLFRAAAGV